MKEPRARPAIVLEETGEALTVLPCAYEDDANGFVHTGVTILDRRDQCDARVRLRPAVSRQARGHQLTR